MSGDRSANKIVCHPLFPCPIQFPCCDTTIQDKVFSRGLNKEELELYTEMKARRDAEDEAKRATESSDEEVDQPVTNHYHVTSASNHEMKLSLAEVRTAM